MTRTTDNPRQSLNNQDSQPIGFTEIGVSGFKSFAQETSIQLGSLTILAGANSSGKSSIMQPLLLMKQTLEAPYDPGALLLDGPNVSFTSGAQLISRTPDSDRFFTVNFSANDALRSRSRFTWSPDHGINISEQFFTFESSENSILIKPDMPSPEIRRMVEKYHPFFGLGTDAVNPLAIVRERCFLECIETATGANYQLANPSFSRILSSLIHVRGLRGNPARIYPTAVASGSQFVGQFENYVADIIDQFQKENPEQLIELQTVLRKLGLTDIIRTRRLNDTQSELRVGRVLGQSDPEDTVNIADVGFGVSQIVPVIVALLVARPSQLVYIEQPEIHLHPRAQIALSEIFADAANRGVRVVVETHSELFLIGIQSLVAEDKLDPSLVRLHWFTRNADGTSKVTSAELDETGAFGDWPEDFGSTALALENRYLSAAEAKLWKATNGSNN